MCVKGSVMEKVIHKYVWGERERERERLRA